MVQMIENWARIGGTVRRLPDPALPTAEWVDVAIEIDTCHDDADYPNLLSGLVGETIAVRVPASDIAQLGLTDGDEVEVRARKATPTDVFGDGPTLRRRI